MITLHQFPPVNGVNVSPFCLKVETYLRLTGTPFTARAGKPFEAPKGKLPYITDGATTLADSSDIIAHLEARSPRPLDQGLDEAGRALGHVIIRTLEEGLYFSVLYDRWVPDHNWDKVRSGFLGNLPPVLRWLLPGVIRRKIRRDLNGQGYGRHLLDEVRARGVADLAAVSALLGDRAFLLHPDRPAVADVVLYAFLVGFLETSFGGPLADAVQARPNLVGHHRRMGALVAAASPPAAA